MFVMIGQMEDRAWGSAAVFGASYADQHRHRPLTHAVCLPILTHTRLHLRGRLPDPLNGLPPPRVVQARARRTRWARA